MMHGNGVMVTKAFGHAHFDLNNMNNREDYKIPKTIAKIVTVITLTSLFLAEHSNYTITIILFESPVNYFL